MIAIGNVIILIISTILTLYFYLKSARPAALEEKIGVKAYKRCSLYRWISGIFMGIVSANYIVYHFFPLSLPIPAHFGWGPVISILIAVLITIPAAFLFIRGMRDAGEETMRPRKEHTMYKGIYRKIRHPQAVGEVVIWWTIALLLNSVHLSIYSIVWIPIFILMCVAEENDLVLRYGAPYQKYQASTGMFIPKIK